MGDATKSNISATSNTENFKISAALKDLIGRELITDEFVAVFELVKNSFDANATNVKVIFENNHKLLKKDSRIIIVDNGKGMNYSDLTDKWLFVAYSAKRLGKENEDYRDKIKVNRIFAGAKGVGRFSCDRLGSQLNLISIKDESNPKIENLVVNWEAFEGVDDAEFIDIDVTHNVLKNIDYSIKHGTVLEVSGLRDDWDRDRILRLKKSLAKLINPSQDNDSDNFSIEIVAEDELLEDVQPDEDDNKKEYWDIVNGEIKNTIFETLEIKTSNILVQITSDGKYIETTLQDRGDFIYYLKEENPYQNEENPNEQLKNINIYLFQLNRAAKVNFKRHMGVNSVEYGSVFMYKNGFRIYPYGEEGDDSLQLDRRKQQGYNRFFGTRDLIGRIEINGEQTHLREITSRDGGLIKNKAHDSLIEFFTNYALKRLENYVVNIIKWGDPRFDKETKKMIHPELMARDVKIEILELISGYINSKNIIDIQYDEDFLEIIKKKQEKGVDKIIKNVRRVAEKSGNPELVKEAKKIEKAVRETREDAKKAEEKAKKEKARRKDIEEELQTEKLKSEFYEKQVSPDTTILIHHIKNNNINVKTTIENILDDIKNDDYTKDELIKSLSFALFHANKAIKAASIITHVDLSESDTQHFELAGFIKGYVENYQEITDERRMVMKHIHKGGLFNVVLSKTELALVIDNLEDNAFKWGAKNILIQTITESPQKFKLIFSDDGKGVSKKYLEKPKSMFKFKETNTKGGSGLGLYIIQNSILKDMGAKISFMGNNLYDLSGATFQITFKR